MEDILDDFHEPDSEKIKQWNAFLDKEQASYYISKWIDIEEGQHFSFNIAPFFLGIFWMLYRKMYRMHFIFIGIIILEGLLEVALIAFLEWYQYENLISNIGNLTFSIVLGFIGNWLYYRHTSRKISELKRSHHNEAELYAALEKTGGTSYMPIFVAILVYGSIILGVVSFFG